MPVGGSQKPTANWWQSVNAGRSWLSMVKSKSAGALDERSSNQDARKAKPVTFKRLICLAF